MLRVWCLEFSVRMLRVWCLGFSVRVTRVGCPGFIVKGVGFTSAPFPFALPALRLGSAWLAFSEGTAASWHHLRSTCFEVWRLGFGFGIQGSNFRVQGLRFRV